MLDFQSPPPLFPPSGTHHYSGKGKAYLIVCLYLHNLMRVESQDRQFIYGSLW